MKEVNSKARTASLKLLVEIGETFIRCSDQSKQGRLSLCDQVTGKGRRLIIRGGKSIGPPGSQKFFWVESFPENFPEIFQHFEIALFTQLITILLYLHCIH